MKMQFKAIAFAAAALAMGQAAWAGEAEAKKWIDSEFQPSTLNKDQQMAEMKWFIDAAKKLQAKGVKEISVVSETITTHEYESKTLAKAFEEITGIKVKHDLIQEGDVVEKLQTSMQSGKSIYDGWISDSDLIGTHYRYGKILNLTDYMGAAGKEWTNPGIDLKDYIGTKFTTGPDGKMYQLPDQQFANLYWFRADLFDRKDIKDKFKAKYGYDLGVPLNWSAYEDIAEFFTNDVKNIDGKPIYGHMDYGKKDPSLGWRFTDAWLSMAGTADIGAPNGPPIDEWGIRVADDKGTPKWRMAPGPNGPYWKQGMQNGYQDVGSWTFFKDHDANKTAAAWLYAQFVTAKTTSLKKTMVGLTPIRESDIQSKAMTDMAPKLGGLVEFYRSPARVAWSPTGTNVPDYPKLAQLWWKNVAQAVTGEKTPQGAMDTLADEMDQVMARLERAGMAHCAPKLNPKSDTAKWLSDKQAPWAKLANEKPKGQTIAYGTLLQAWKDGKAR